MAEPAVELIPECVECAKKWLPRDTDRWQAHWLDDGPDELLLFYCEQCSEREFGDGT